MWTIASGVYEILNTTNGKRYIGSTANMVSRWKTHCYKLKRNNHHSPTLQSAWNKYGPGAFEFITILICQKSMLRFYEQQLLDKVKPEYNISRIAGAPMSGRKHTVESRIKMSKSRRGEKKPPLTPEHCANISKAKAGEPHGPHSAETRAKMSASAKGKRKSLEHIKKIGDTQRGQKRGPLTAEHRAKISVANTGRKYPTLIGNKNALGQGKSLPVIRV